MADENDSQPSKKRAAGVQLSRDNPGLDDDEDISEQEGGTFQRASDEVLATRRIVKVRRPSSASAPASNPFANIRLATSADSAPPVPVEASNATSAEAEQINEIDVKSENNADVTEGEPSSLVNRADVSDKKSEGMVGESKGKPDETEELANQSITESVVEEVAEGKNSDVAKSKLVAGAEQCTAETVNDVETKIVAEAGQGATETVNAVESKEIEKETEKNSESASFSSFRQLSSGQNAFSGFGGTGSSGGEFSFGSIPKDGTPSTTGFGFGHNGNSSIFGVSGASNQIGGSKIPSMTPVTVETGEENEKAVFTANSVLFEFIDGSWKERGKGELKVNISTMETGKARLVMRARGNYRLILNASLFPDMKLTMMEKKGVTFACVNSASEEKDSLSTIALKFKDPSVAEEFKECVMEHKDARPSSENCGSSQKPSDD